jgi:hypothetical protein
VWQVPSLADTDLTDLVERWIFQRVEPNVAALDVPIPSDRITKQPVGGITLPAVKFTYQSDVVTRGVGLNAYYFTMYHYAVRGVTTGTDTTILNPISAAIYASLADVVDETDYGLVVLASTFFSHFRLEHHEDQERYVELGGIYQIHAQLKE